MTVTVGTNGAPGLNDLLSRTESLLTHRSAVAQWWVDLVECLDQLAARATGLRSDRISQDALAEQIRMDAPHLYSSLRRLEEESEELQADILRVRISAGDSIGDEARVGALTNDVRGVMRRLRRLELRSNSVVIDAYDRDIGGE